MYDIFKNMWKTPASAYTPLPFWFWNDKLDRDELIRQLDDFHKKGIDAFIIHPRIGMETEYLSDEYLELTEAVLEAAEKRFMSVVLYDEAMYPSGSAHGKVAAEDKRFAARALTAVKTSEAPSDAEVLYRVWVKNDDNSPLDIKLDSTDGYESYDLILDYTEGTIRGLLPDEDDGRCNAPKAADILNPAAVEAFIKHTHDVYNKRLSRFFGKTIIGFFTDEPSPAGRNAKMNGKISWTYGMLEEFFECGGDFAHLVSLLLPLNDKNRKLRRDAERIYKKALRLRLDNAYYKTLSNWCTAHGIALMGHPAESGDCETVRMFDIPGQDLVWRMVEEGSELTSPDSVMAKCASDAARHSGAPRNSNECFGVCGKKGNPWDFTPDDMMWYLNFLFARGCNMIIPHAFYYSLRTPIQSNERPPDVGPNNIWWKDYRKLAMYIKRMSWLNYACTNNPHAAVLCSADYMPVKPVAPLYQNGYTFNYLTIDDFMNRAHIHDGKIRIDRYSYDILLVDGRLPLDTKIVERLGRFAIEEGKLYRGNDFIDFMKKNAVRKSYFEGTGTENLRFTHLTKSGYPFFLMINEGREEISGKLITDISGEASDFDPMSGKITPVGAELCENGFSYSVTIPPHTARIIGIDKDALPILADSHETSQHLSEIISLNADHMSFNLYHPAEKVILSFTDIHDIADISVNGKPAGRLIFRPYEADITELINDGENIVEVNITGSMANIYGNPVPVGFDGCTVRVFR